MILGIDLLVNMEGAFYDEAFFSDSFDFIHKLKSIIKMIDDSW